MAKELARLDIDIAALREVRFAEQGSLTEDGAGYNFCSRKNKDERCLFSVGFMIKISVARELRNLFVGHSDLLMSLRLTVQDNKFATVFSVYAPTLQADSGVKQALYRDLHNLLQQVDSKDKLLIIGDFSARVGTRLRTVERSPR